MVATPWPPFQRALQTRCFFIRVRTRTARLGAKRNIRRSLPFASLLVAATMLTVTPIRAQETDRSPLFQPASEVTGRGVEAYPRYHIPRSSSHSIYFLPGSADLDDSAKASIAFAAKHLAANSAVTISVVAYGDDVEDGTYGVQLRMKRATAVADAFDASGIPRHRISITASKDQGLTSEACTSEYCRQSYRRVGLVFAGALKK
jgi:outer membrane protein OmpA-like peptidoglycan-associated protein